MKFKLVLITGTLAVALAAVGAALAAQTPAGATASLSAAAAPGQTVIIYSFGRHIVGDVGIKGPDGLSHDTIAPANFVLKKGVPATIKVINYDEGAHSITAPSLGLNLTIKPGIEKGATVTPVTTTFTFTPTKTGVFRWWCALPCDKHQNFWAMNKGYGGPGKEGFMAGSIVVM